MIRNDPHPFGDLIGIEMVEADDGVAVTRAEARAELLNPVGVVHGGVLFSLADTSMGAAVLSLLNESELCTTIESQVRFFAPAKEGVLTSVAEVVSRGRRVMQVEARTTDASGRLISMATASFAVLGA